MSTKNGGTMAPTENKSQARLKLSRIISTSTTSKFWMWRWTQTWSSRCFLRLHEKTDARLVFRPPTLIQKPTPLTECFIKKFRELSPTLKLKQRTPESKQRLKRRLTRNLESALRGTKSLTAVPNVHQQLEKDKDKELLEVRRANPPNPNPTRKSPPRKKKSHLTIPISFNRTLAEALMATSWSRSQRTLGKLPGKESKKPRDSWSREERHLSSLNKQPIGNLKLNSHQETKSERSWLKVAPSRGETISFKAKYKN